MFAEGGIVHGPRDPGDDSIPVFLSGCETVIQARLVNDMFRFRLMSIDEFMRRLED
jgi:hypothetical protein